MLVIDESGNNLGKIHRDKALALANEKDLDLVVVSGDSKVVVAKMMNYSKYRYDQQRKLREMKKKQHFVDVKEIRLSPTIDVHDFNTKLNNAKKFIAKGDKVKITLRLRGRMITYSQAGLEVVNNFIREIADIITIEVNPKLEGSQIIAIISPSNK